MGDLVARYGPWAVVTGASSGIGQAVARQLSAAGLGVVVVARRADRLDALVAELGGPARARAVPLDLTEPDAVAWLRGAVADLDVGLVVHSAGVGLGGEHLSAALERHQQMLDLNCRSTLEVVDVFLPGLLARGRGGLVLLASVVGFTGVPWAAHYSATKAYVMSLGEALQHELRGSGVDISVVAPGPTLSEFGSHARMTMTAGATPEAVARTIVRRLSARGVVLTDLFAWAIRLSTVWVPRRLVVWIMGQVMGGMTRGRHDGHQISVAGSP